ncbi:hypothetical protein [Fulvivirga sediminis]|uniref:Uncharacterized protein n=1 Tax=Fulvivirga sediminis TaxID=2803949 RepID=A0A937FAN2_9BACT|nr:hypothetical protein [Fulvivirga sediminis]MBL3658411.1 hypothetical protein [Fulvivirga sediminis]
MKKYLIFILILAASKTMAQVPLPPAYLDLMSIPVLIGESTAAGALGKAKNKTSLEYVKTGIGTAVETAGTAELGKPVQYVYFVNYADMCEPFVGHKQKLCEEKVKYLEKAHDVVFELLSINPLYEMRKGVKDLIWQKYANISGIIITELDKIKRESEKEKKKRDFQYEG